MLAVRISAPTGVMADRSARGMCGVREGGRYALGINSSCRDEPHKCHELTEANELCFAEVIYVFLYMVSRAVFGS